MINASNLICKTAGCPQFGDWAIKKGLTVKWANAKRGDLVLFDFNNNGTSDHIGIVTKATSSYIETIEGNTGNGSNTNGDGVYRRKRYKSQVNYFVRPKYTKSATAEMVIATAEAELGYKEGRNNNNKYGRWFGLNYVSWCCIFIVWVFAHLKGEIKAITKPTGKYSGELPTAEIKVGMGSLNVKRWQKFLNWYGVKLDVDSEFGGLTEDATKVFQKTEKLTVDGICGKKTIAKAKTYLDGKQEQNLSKPIQNPTTKKAYSGKFPDLIEFSGELLCQTAKQMAWPKGTSKAKYTYGKGSAKESYTKALRKVFPKRTSWGSKPKVGASCDVASAVPIRASGADTSCPRGLAQQIPHIKKSSRWKNVGVKNLKGGDVMLYLNKGQGGHIAIVAENGKNYYEGSFTNGYFLHFGSKLKTNTKSFKYLAHFRVNTIIRAIRKGDAGEQVKRMQAFLKWYGADLKADGEYGDKTETAVKNFQYKEGLTVDGEFGEKSISKAKAIRK